MPTFDEFGGDEWICQVCGKIQSSQVESEWRPDITGHKSAGNVCPICVLAYENKPMSLYEHCRRESGLQGQALREYINRHYGLE